MRNKNKTPLSLSNKIIIFNYSSSPWAFLRILQHFVSLSLVLSKSWEIIQHISYKDSFFQGHTNINLLFKMVHVGCHNVLKYGPLRNAAFRWRFNQQTYTHNDQIPLVRKRFNSLVTHVKITSIIPLSLEAKICIDVRSSMCVSAQMKVYFSWKGNEIINKCCSLQIKRKRLKVSIFRNKS